jgi:GT2 family glycosyltransferase
LSSIPPVIHQTWRDRHPPAEMARLALTWRRHHPRWRYKLWTDTDCRALVERHAPWFLPVYDGYQEAIMRVDAFRYFLMFHVGGVYADLDLECLRPLDALVGDHGAAVALEPDEHLREEVVRASGLARVVGNAWLASAPGHRFWEHVIARLVNARAAAGPLEATGPFLLTRALTDWSGEEPVVLPSATVYAIPKRQVWAGALGDPQARRRLCAQGAFAVHHWMGTWVHAPQGRDRTPAGAVLQLAFRGQLIEASALRRAESDLEGRPLISALMVTKDRPPLAAASIECFRRQTWEPRELVIVDDGGDDTLAEHVRALGDTRVRLVRLRAERLPLGTLRNRAVAEARGEYVCQWDDDDLSHPHRMALQIAAARSLEADACVLRRETLWWPRQGRVAVSCARLWESSLLVRKAVLPAYPALARGEDTPVVEALAQTRRVAVLDQPELHVYVVHGDNSFPASHFDHHWRAATASWQGAAATDRLRRQVPFLPVDAVLGALARGPGRAPDCEPRRSGAAQPNVLILTPVKDAAPHLDRFLAAVRALDWPPDRISLGFLESDSRDQTYQCLAESRPALERIYRRVALWKRDFGFHPDVPRWEPSIQRERRSILARSRNELLERTLAPTDEWVLWLDSDVQRWPPDMIQQLLAAEKDIVVPHVVSADTGDTFDLNTWCAPISIVRASCSRSSPCSTSLKPRGWPWSPASAVMRPSGCLSSGWSTVDGASPRHATHGDSSGHMDAGESSRSPTPNRSHRWRHAVGSHANSAEHRRNRRRWDHPSDPRSTLTYRLHSPTRRYPPDSGSGGSNAVGVRVSPTAQIPRVCPSVFRSGNAVERPILVRCRCRPPARCWRASKFSAGLSPGRVVSRARVQTSRLSLASFRASQTVSARIVRSPGERNARGLLRRQFSVEEEWRTKQ